MKAKPYRSYIIALLLMIGFSNVIYAQQSDTTIHITAKQLQAMPANQFLNGNSGQVVKSCIVTLEDGTDLIEFKIKSQSIPEKLKEKLGTSKVGKLVIVESRIAVVDGKEIKLPAIIYSIIEEKI